MPQYEEFLPSEMARAIRELPNHSTIVSADATIRQTSSVPTVTVRCEGDADNRVLHFTFDGIRGKDGTVTFDGLTDAQRMSLASYVGRIAGMTASVGTLGGVPSVVVTEGGTVAQRTYHLEFNGIQGPKGDGVVGVTASVDDTIGNPSVTVTESEAEGGSTYHLAFTGLRGIQGPKGDMLTDGDVERVSAQILSMFGLAENEVF